MLVIVRGCELPGRRFPHGATDVYDNVHVALQVRREPVGLVPGDAADAEWRTHVDIVDREGRTDYRGPAVHGKAGERFLYLTWGTVDEEVFTMFRRAKIMLGDAPPDPGAERAVVASVALTDEKGLPRCARIRAPAIAWAIE
ncbi:MAG: DUF5990 family protein [Nocardioidaceae bacterium]